MTVPGFFIDAAAFAPGQVLHTFELNAGSVTTLGFSPSGNALLVAWEDGYLRVHDLATGKLESSRNGWPRGDA